MVREAPQTPRMKRRALELGNREEADPESSSLIIEFL